ncbi:hypothetical protein VTG60DRAFT_6257 [Thermothelomyces hinnuleus]
MPCYSVHVRPSMRSCNRSRFLSFMHLYSIFQCCPRSTQHTHTHTIVYNGELDFLALSPQTTCSAHSCWFQFFGPRLSLVHPTLYPRPADMLVLLSSKAKVTSLLVLHCGLEMNETPNERDAPVGLVGRPSAVFVSTHSPSGTARDWCSSFESRASADGSRSGGRASTDSFIGTVS